MIITLNRPKPPNYPPAPSPAVSQNILCTPSTLVDYPLQLIERALQIGLYYAKQTQSKKHQNYHNYLQNKDLPQFSSPPTKKKQTQTPGQIEAKPRSEQGPGAPGMHIGTQSPAYKTTYDIERSPDSSGMPHRDTTSYIRNSEFAQLIDQRKRFWYLSTGPAESGICLRF